MYRTPGAMLPGYAEYQGPAVGDFPVAERVHGSLIKLPVWHREQDRQLADDYIAAVAKVARHHKDLVR